MIDLEDEVVKLMVALREGSRSHPHFDSTTGTIPYGERTSSFLTINSMTVLLVSEEYDGPPTHDLEYDMGPEQLAKWLLLAKLSCE